MKYYTTMDFKAILYQPRKYSSHYRRQGGLASEQQKVVSTLLPLFLGLVSSLICLGWPFAASEIRSPKDGQSNLGCTSTLIFYTKLPAIFVAGHHCTLTNEKRDMIGQSYLVTEIASVTLAQGSRNSFTKLHVDHHDVLPERAIKPQ